MKKKTSSKVTTNPGKLLDHTWKNPAPNVAAKQIDTFLAERGRRSPQPAIDAATQIQTPPQQVPPGLELFAQMQHLSPTEIVASQSPKFAEALKTSDGEKTKEACAGLFWGMGVDMGVPLPDWAKAASEKAWQAMGLDFLRHLATDPAAAGKLVELANLTPQKDNATPLEQAANNLVGHIKIESGNLTADEQEKYVKGRKAAPKIIEKLEEKATNERVQAFLCIASQWREVEKLGSRNKTFYWLMGQRTPQGHLIFSPRTDWAEVKDWLAEINLPKGRAGRPKKEIRTLAKSENPVSSKKRKSSL